jgi:hypothetical protein
MKILCMILLPALLLINGCAPSTVVYELTPAEKDIEWIHGVGMMQKAERDIFISAGFAENHGDLLSFSVIIENRSENDVTVDPAKFECVDQSSLPFEKKPVRIPASRALDPESMIQQADAEISAENSSYETGQALNSCGLFFRLLEDIVTIGKEKSCEEIINREAEDRRMAEQEEEHDERILSLSGKKEFWQHHAFRITTLHPGQTAEGNVFFHPIERDALILLRIPIDGFSFEIPFDQKKTYR